MDESSEIFDVVDQNDRVIGQATRREVHKNSWLHRSIHIFVFNNQKDIFLQKRVLTKDENPGYWDSSVSGHVNSGEDYLTSAHRELKEELGISGSLKPFIKFPACRETFWEHMQSYLCITDQTIQINPHEIMEGRYWKLDELKAEIKKNPGIFTSSFHCIFHSYVKTVGPTQPDPAKNL